MLSARPNRFGVPRLPFPAFLTWYIAGDGRILSSEGTAAADYPSEIARVIGCQFRDALPPAAARRIERAMSGEAVAEFGDTWGGRWFNLVTPSICGWGVDGWSIQLPDNLAAGALAGVHTWFVHQSMRVAGCEIPRGSAIQYDGELYMALVPLPGDAATEAMRLNPPAFEYRLPAEPASHEHPPEVSPPPPVGAGRSLLLIR